ncbi:hypothetical protein IP92_03046 [Pseudoduganella flava]|uniref:Uncharacterized protein n=1 Tax=Pseudoduganella flava TaxID=871742 RepID=A0A562PQQ5_9BURK|nr:hypothetical protein [Pseudoduganella flava]TWI46683.1 hypothetical protein IP92_03046 [Pseudoduganella flava]
MSYLHPLRLHFAGKFQANVSTVNNDPGHFNNATFDASYQKLKGSALNGWWNPQGDASWRLLGCRVTSAWGDTGPVDAGDPILAFTVADSDTRVSAKLADLDSEQQMVSQIWGLQVRLVDQHGNTLLRANYQPAAFTDIWNRAQVGGGDMVACAAYLSVLTDLEWGDIAASPFLRHLREACAGTGKLSIMFNLDGYSMDYTSPDFTCGRIAGTIGPLLPDEPDHVLLGRHLIATPLPGSGGFFIPTGQLNHCGAVLHDAARCLLLDLGNALPTVTVGGVPVDLGDLTVSASGSGGNATVLGKIPAQGPDGYLEPGWYARTAGVVSLPLDDAQLAAAVAAPLAIAGAPQAAQPVYLAEPPSGAYVRADQFVFRLSPGEKASIPVRAMRWGRPLPDTEIALFADPSQLQPSNSINQSDVPPVGVPAEAIPFNRRATTDAQGIALIEMTPGDPGTPRYFNGGTSYGIDGQVYGIRPLFADPALQGPMNQWDFVSILLWSGFAPAQPVTWDTLQPIFQQYANLYPVMNRFLDMGDYDQVVANADLLKLAFGLDPANPNAMPATRDLSPTKRQVILQWLADPRRGTGTPAFRPQGPAVDDQAGAAQPMLKGGKAAAAARRLVVRQMQ